MDILPRLIDRKAENGEVEIGVYTELMTKIIEEGAYDADGHMNTQFLEEEQVGPYPQAMQEAWTRTREEAARNYGIEGEEGTDAWEKNGTARGANAGDRKKQRGCGA